MNIFENKRNDPNKLMVFVRSKKDFVRSSYVVTFYALNVWYLKFQVFGTMLKIFAEI